ncbi:hypothetical protein [Streptomyces sp. NPDC002215]|uniref:hypothetical protein n=1 Tax=Streptomyces sp. NPDC002215 TaxID=3154412 RepID=UPI00331B989A
MTVRRGLGAGTQAPAPSIRAALLDLSPESACPTSTTCEPEAYSARARPRPVPAADPRNRRRRHREALRDIDGARINAI